MTNFKTPNDSIVYSHKQWYLKRMTELEKTNPEKDVPSEYSDIVKTLIPMFIIDIQFDFVKPEIPKKSKSYIQFMLSPDAHVDNQFTSPFNAHCCK